MHRAFIIPLLIVPAIAAATPASAGIEGVWRNRPKTLVVKIAQCGSALCGTIIEADEGAKESTRKAGTAHLIGTRVLSGLYKVAADTYKGDVFNPNLNIHASGTITQVGPNVLVIRGCVLAGLICKQQHWMRLG